MELKLALTILSLVILTLSVMILVFGIKDILRLDKSAKDSHLLVNRYILKETI